MTDVLLVCSSRMASVINLIAMALSRLELDVPTPVVGTVPSEAALQTAKTVVVFFDDAGQFDWALDPARTDHSRFVFVTAGAPAIDLPGETVALSTDSLSIMILATGEHWQLLLKAIEMRVGRPGIAEFNRALAAGDAAALGAWIEIHPDDPLVPRAQEALAPIVRRWDDQLSKATRPDWIDHRVKPYYVGPSTASPEDIKNVVKEFGNEGMPASGKGDYYYAGHGTDTFDNETTSLPGIDFAERTVSMLYATDRQKQVGIAGLKFTGERAEELSFGGAVVRVPEQHKVGRLELPFKLKLFSWELITLPTDPTKHFVLKSTQEMTREAWCANIAGATQSDILIFVHGFKTTFEQAALHFGQIAFDLQCKAIPILYSWPSRGEVQDYRYDDESTNISKDRFAGLLTMLAALPNAKRIHVLAHSMGNKVVLEALAQLVPTAPVGIAEVMMAAPDVDSIRFKQIAGQIRTIVKGMTLYASSADKALALSKGLSGLIARAGDVPPGGPVIVPGIEAIDVTALGAELFGLNHATFAESRSILNDVHLVMTQGTRPPNARLPELLSVPLGAAAPTHWKYAE